MKQPIARSAIHLAAAVAVSLVVMLAGRPAALLQAQMSPSANPGPQTWSVQVDNTSPEGHNWGFTTYYPNHLQAHAGDTITWSVAINPNAFHTVTLLPAGMTPDQAPFTPVAPALDAPGSFQFPFFIDEPATPCGKASQTACSFDGKSVLNSGALFAAPPPEAGGGQGNFTFTTKLDSALTPGTYYYICLVHGPGMSGSFDILPAAQPAQSADALKADAGREYSADLDALSSSALTNSVPTQTSHADGTTTWGVAAGGGFPDTRVSADEFGVKNLFIKAGDSVTWTMQSGPQEVHTVTGFGSQLGQEPPELDIDQQVCHLATGDVSPPPNTFPLDIFNTCPGHEEDLASQYSFATAPSGSAYTGTPVTSGILVPDVVLQVLPPPVLAAFPILSSYTITFPQAGTYTYHCVVHQGMDAVVTVLTGQ